MTGRRIWVVLKAETRPNEDADGPWIIPASVYSTDVRSFRQFLPRGAIIDPINSKVVGQRDRTLVQVTTDPGGTRTIAVADIHLKDPGRQHS